MRHYSGLNSSVFEAEKWPPNCGKSSLYSKSAPNQPVL